MVVKPLVKMGCIAGLLVFFATGCVEEQALLKRNQESLLEMQQQLFTVSEQLSELQAAQERNAQLALRSDPVVRVKLPPQVVQRPTKMTNIKEMFQRQRPIVSRRSRSKKAKRRRTWVDRRKKHVRVNSPVREVQTALKAAGCYNGKIDGKVGEQTVAAIRTFQTQNALKVDGIVGPATWRALQVRMPAPATRD